MTGWAHLVAFHLLVLHAPGGSEIDVNPREITSLRSRPEVKDRDSRIFSENIKCLISLSDGKYVAVSESCEEVRGMIDRLSNGDK